jgi:anti-sigma B factor antagonist
MHTSIESLADGVVVVSVRGEVDVFSAPLLKEELFACLDCAPRRLIVDVTGSDFVDSTGLGVLVAGARRARACAFAVVCDDGPTRHIFTIVGLDQVFGLYRTRSDALRDHPVIVPGPASPVPASTQRRPPL